MCFFTAYLEALAHATPDSEVRGWVREILEEEYMRPRVFEWSHPALCRRFMRAIGFADGEWDTVPALPATHAFIRLHLDMTLRSWLETLGAVGPGHEWAIPPMFSFLVQGIERSLALEPDALAEALFGAARVPGNVLPGSGWSPISTRSPAGPRAAPVDNTQALVYE